MLHPVPPIDLDAYPEIKTLLSVVRETLAFVLENVELQAIPVNTVRAGFRLHHAAKGHPQTAADWLWTHYATIRKPLLALLALPLVDKASLLAAFDADNDLVTCFQTGGRFACENLPPGCTAYPHVKALMGNLYKLCFQGGGVPAGILGQEGVNRQTLLRAYLDMNQKKLQVCPGCDGSPPSIDDGVIHADLDHFFPKSLFPFLAIHPHNLTPFCKDCNQAYKKAKNIFRAPRVKCLADIYHPYYRAARDEIEVRIDRRAARGTLRLRLIPCSPGATTRLRSLNYLLKIKNRWRGDLKADRLHDNVQTAFLHDTSDQRRDAGFVATDNWTRSKMDTIANDKNSRIGSIQNELPSAAYARFSAIDADKIREWQKEFDCQAVGTRTRLDPAQLPADL